MTTVHAIVFSGELIDGFERDQVMAAFGRRFGLAPAQVDKVFCGRAVTLKKGLPLAQARAYLAALAALGMRARAAAPKAPAVGGGYAIVFDGAVRTGFERQAVIDAAMRRLKLGEAQCALLFSGRPVTMKRGLAEKKARHYIETLHALGLAARAEPALPESAARAHSEEIAAQASLMATQFDTPIYNFDETFHSSSSLQVIRPEADEPPPEAPPARVAQVMATQLNDDVLRQYEDVLAEEEDPAIAQLRAAHDAPAAAPQGVAFDFTRPPPVASMPPADEEPQPRVETLAPPEPEPEPEPMPLPPDEPVPSEAPARGIPTGVLIGAMTLVAAALIGWLLLTQ